jgi:hypothetical protein
VIDAKLIARTDRVRERCRGAANWSQSLSWMVSAGAPGRRRGSRAANNAAASIASWQVGDTAIPIARRSS